MVLFRDGKFTTGHWRLLRRTSLSFGVTVGIPIVHSGSQKSQFLTKYSPFSTKSTSTSLPVLDSRTLGWGTSQGGCSCRREWSKQRCCSFSRQNYHQTRFCTVFGAYLWEFLRHKESEGMIDVGTCYGECNQLNRLRGHRKEKTMQATVSYHKTIALSSEPRSVPGACRDLALESDEIRLNIHTFC